MPHFIKKVYFAAQRGIRVSVQRKSFKFPLAAVSTMSSTVVYAPFATVTVFAALYTALSISFSS